ncbi:hypothetical protein LINGRAHAP2_LOCUS27874, partial [Linum grandiflorum]
RKLGLEQTKLSEKKILVHSLKLKVSVIVWGTRGHSIVWLESIEEATYRVVVRVYSRGWRARLEWEDSKRD